MAPVDGSDLDLNLLAALDVLLAERNVTRAARRLGLTQSSMSHTLARLRNALSDPLMVRAGRAMVPTPRAEAGLARRLGLAVLDVPLPLPAIPVVLAWHERVQADPGHTWFRERLAAAGKAVLAAGASDARESVGGRAGRLRPPRSAGIRRR